MSAAATPDAGSRAATGGAAGSAAGSATRPGLLAGRSFVEVRFGGSGGQGVVLMGVILAMAATRDHRYVVQTQSYGPEARGGYSRSDVIVSDAPIDYPELQGADLLVVLSQDASDQYAHLLRQDGILLYDVDGVSAPPAFKGPSFGIPFTRLAYEETGFKRTTNILTLGAVAGITGVVSVESLQRAVQTVVPKGTEEMNEKALARGLALDPDEWRRSG